jgi:hypothetical protein
VSVYKCTMRSQSGNEVSGQAREKEAASLYRYTRTI